MIQSSTRKLLAVLGAAILAVVLAAPMASAAEPAEGYEQFAGCPSPEEFTPISFCIRSEITGGHFEMGNKTVPIENPITLSGGIDAVTGKVVASPEGGLSKVKQQVPGGIVGLTGLDWLVNFFGFKALQLFAVTELAGEPSNPLEEPLTLPIRVRLINPLLGDECYVGSFSNPIVLNLTTKTTEPPPPNEPITGVEPEQTIDPETFIFSFEDGVFVDNAFAAPGANGCEQQLFGFIPVGLDSLVNFSSGLPSAAGTNETVQEFDSEATFQNLVYP